MDLMTLFSIESGSEMLNIESRNEVLVFVGSCAIKVVAEKINAMKNTFLMTSDFWLNDTPSYDEAKTSPYHFCGINPILVL